MAMPIGAGAAGAANAPIAAAQGIPVSDLQGALLGAIERVTLSMSLMDRRRQLQGRPMTMDYVFDVTQAALMAALRLRPPFIAGQQPALAAALFEVQAHSLVEDAFRRLPSDIRTTNCTESTVRASHPWRCLARQASLRQPCLGAVRPFPSSDDHPPPSYKYL